MLRLAKRWVIVGYSFPAEDLAIRSLLLRAYRGREEGMPLPEILVIQRKKNEALSARYTAIFPEAKFQWTGLEAFLKSWENRRRKR